MSLVILEIDGIAGECGLEQFKDKILCETLSHDIELEIEMSHNARRTVHVPTVANFSLSRKWDKASVPLIKKILTGKVSATEWKIHCLKPLDDDSSFNLEFLTIILKNAILAKYSVEVNEGDTTENLEINATNITWEYKPDPKGGTIPVEFDVLAGKIVK